MTGFVFDQNFCLDLQVHLNKTFSNSPDPDIALFWCDGIAVPDDAQLWAKQVNMSRKIMTKAWIGEDGQTSCQMTILLGPKALSRYARGLDLYPCLPDSETDDWVQIDLEKKEIQLQLR